MASLAEGGLSACVNTLPPRRGSLCTREHPPWLRGVRRIRRGPTSTSRVCTCVNTIPPGRGTVHMREHPPWLKGWGGCAHAQTPYLDRCRLSTHVNTLPPRGGAVLMREHAPTMRVSLQMSERLPRLGGRGICGNGIGHIEEHPSATKGSCARM